MNIIVINTLMIKSSSLQYNSHDYSCTEKSPSSLSSSSSCSITFNIQHYSGLLVHRRMGPKFTSRLALSHRLLPCLWGQWCTLNVINITITITIVIIGIIISMAKIAGTILCKDDRGVWGQDGDQKVIVSYIFAWEEWTTHPKMLEGQKSKIKRKKSPYFFRQVLQF